MARYRVTYKESFEGCGITEVYEVRISDNDWPVPFVWWDPAEKKACCGVCSGPLAAMSSSCAHAKAVKRFKMKEQKET